jgi:hypothetical protein
MENRTLEGMEGCTTPVLTAEEVEAGTDIGSTVEVEGAEVVVVWTTGGGGSGGGGGALLLPASDVNNCDELSAARITEDPPLGSRAAETHTRCNTHFHTHSIRSVTLVRVIYRGTEPIWWQVLSVVTFVSRADERQAPTAPWTVALWKQSNTKAVELPLAATRERPAGFLSFPRFADGRGISTS